MEDNGDIDYIDEFDYNDYEEDTQINEDIDDEDEEVPVFDNDDDEYFYYGFED